MDLPHRFQQAQHIATAMVRTDSLLQQFAVPPLSGDPVMTYQTSAAPAVSEPSITEWLAILDPDTYAVDAVTSVDAIGIAAANLGTFDDKCGTAAATPSSLVASVATEHSVDQPPAAAAQFEPVLDLKRDRPVGDVLSPVMAPPSAQDYAAPAPAPMSCQPTPCVQGPRKRRRTSGSAAASSQFVLRATTPRAKALREQAKAKAKREAEEAAAAKAAPAASSAAAASAGPTAPTPSPRSSSRPTKPAPKATATASPTNAKAGPKRRRRRKSVSEVERARKERNRRSAATSRQRAREYVESLEAQVKQLMEHNTMVQTQVEALAAQNEELRARLADAEASLAVSATALYDPLA